MKSEQMDESANRFSEAAEQWAAGRPEQAVRGFGRMGQGQNED